MIKWQYRDDRDWTDVNGVVTSWTNYALKYKDTSVHPSFIEPIKTKDTWNGVEIDIQHKRYDSYEFEINVKESEKKSLSQILSCSDQRVIDYEENSSGTIINKEYIFDTGNFDNIEIEELESNIANTTGSAYKIRFRANKTIINKGLPVLRTNTLHFADSQWRLVFDYTTNGYSDNFDESSIILSSGAICQKYILGAGSWVTSGNPFNPGGVDNPVCVLSDTRIAVMESGQFIETFDFDGTDWTSTGNQLDTTRSGSSICKLSSTEVAVYASSDNTIRKYSFDGTDWSQDGNALSITAGSAKICQMTSSKIALIDPTGGELRDYDWSSPNWAVNDTIAASVSGNAGVAKLGSDRVAVCDTGTQILKSYVLSGTWSAESGTLASVSGSILGSLGANSVLVNGTDLYSYGKYYYSDYDVIDYSEQLEPIRIDWPDGSTKIAKTIDKKGESILIYLETSDYDDFITYLKTTSSIYLNDTLITEYNYEPSEIGEGLWKVIFYGIETITQTDFNLAPLATYTLSMNSGIITYNSDYPYYERIRDTINVETKWYDGSTKVMQTVKKLTYDFVYFTSDPQTFIKNIGTYDDITLNAKVLTEIQTNVEEIAINLFKITLNGVHTIDIDNLYTFPTSGGTLVITDEVPTAHTYYTDYTSETIPIASDKNTINNQTGINVTTKSITKTALRLRFYIGQTNAFAIKQYCELFKPGWTCTWNAGTVYEILNSDNIEPRLLDNSPLNNAIYEVIVDILTAVTTN